MAKKRNRPDATDINVKASHKRDATDHARIIDLRRRVYKLEDLAVRFEAWMQYKPGAKI